MSLDVQFLTLWMMFVCGLGLGVVFDLYRVVSDELRLPRWIIAIMDILYWILAAIAVFRVLYFSNQGDLRVFVFIGLFIGIGVYFLLFSSFVQKTTILLIKVLKKMIWFVLRLFHIFVAVPFRALYKVFTIFMGLLMVIPVFLYKFVIQLFYPLWKWVYHLIKKVKS